MYYLVPNLLKFMCKEESRYNSSSHRLFSTHKIRRLVKRDSKKFGIKSFVLNSGCTNTTFSISIGDLDTKFKLSIYSVKNSYLSESQMKLFLDNRQRFNRDLNPYIVYANKNVLINKFVEGNPLLSIMKDDNDFKVLNSEVIESILEFQRSYDSFDSSNYGSTIDFAASDTLNYFYYSLNSFNLISDRFSKEIIKRIEKIRKFEFNLHKDDIVVGHMDTDPVNLVFTSSNEVKLIDFDYVHPRAFKYYDFANYYNVIKEINGVSEEVLDDFLVRMSETFSEWNESEFFLSVNIMKFVWGLWYYLYGKKLSIQEYEEIGYDWIKSSKINEGDYAI